MSELFDSLNLSTSAGPSSSQQSSSQPSTSKVFWHASPSPGVLRQLANWTPSKGQESPTLPLCTQAFVGELKKLPSALEAHSPLLARDSTKRKKFLDTPRSASRHVSDPLANRSRTREYIDLDLSDEDEDGKDGPKRLLLGDSSESSPESRRRRTMDAGNTGRLRDSSSPSQCSVRTLRTAVPLNADKDPQQSTSSHRRLDRRPPRRRKKESFIAGLGFTDDAGGATDCLKLFEDLQAAIQGMHGSRPSTSGSISSTTDRPTVTFDGGSREASGLTPREGINRTFSAPTASRSAQLSQQEHEEQQVKGAALVKDDPLTPRRGLRPVKSEQDVFKPVGHASTRPLQPRPLNLPEDQAQGRISVGREGASTRAEQGYSEVRDELSPRSPHRPEVQQPRAMQPVAITEPSPVKRSARIEAMQTNSSSKKLGVRGPSLLSKSVSPRNKSCPLTTTTTPSRKLAAPLSTSARTRTHAFPLGARQPGLPRSSSQFVPSQTIAASQHNPTATVGPAAPFRPPAIHTKVTRSLARPAVSLPRSGQPSSEDSFGDVDDDAAFLALACELEY